MAKVYKLQDGHEVEFSDNATPAQMRSYLVKNFPDRVSRELAQKHNLDTSQQSLQNNAAQESRTTSASGGIKGGEDIEPSINEGNILKGAGRGALNIGHSALQMVPGERGVERGINKIRSGDLSAPTLGEQMEDSPLGPLIGLAKAEGQAGSELGSQIKAGEGGRAAVTGLSMLDPLAVGSVSNVNDLQNQGRRGEAIGQGGADVGALAAPFVAKGLNAARGPIGRAMVRNAPTIGKIGGTATGIAGIPKTGGLSLLTIPRASSVLTNALKSTGEFIQPRAPLPAATTLPELSPFEPNISPTSSTVGQTPELTPEQESALYPAPAEEFSTVGIPPEPLPGLTPEQSAALQPRPASVGFGAMKHRNGLYETPQAEPEAIPETRQPLPQNSSMASAFRKRASSIENQTPDELVGDEKLPYRVSGIRGAADALEGLDQPYGETPDLGEVPGIGEGSLERMATYRRSPLPGAAPGYVSQGTNNFLTRAFNATRARQPIPGAISIDPEVSILDEEPSEIESSGHGGDDVTSAEENARGEQHYVIGKNGGSVTGHGSKFVPESTPPGGTHVSVLPDGSVRTNQGLLTPAQKSSLDRVLAKRNQLASD